MQHFTNALACYANVERLLPFPDYTPLIASSPLKLNSTSHSEVHVFLCHTAICLTHRHAFHNPVPLFWGIV